MAFSTAPQFSTVRVNLCDIRKSPSEIKEYAISLLGPDFEAEFHPQYKEVLIITHKSYKKTETDGNYGQIGGLLRHRVLLGCQLIFEDKSEISNLKIKKKLCWKE